MKGERNDTLVRTLKACVWPGKASMLSPRTPWFWTSNWGCRLLRAELERTDTLVLDLKLGVSPDKR